MVDVFTPDKRSRLMARIRTRDTRPEIIVRQLIHGMGYRFRLHVTTLPGKPDIVLPRHRKVILVHGCFWHGHPRCLRGKLPASNIEFWNKKIGGNVERDHRTATLLRRLGWQVLVLWECQIKSGSFGNLLRDFLDKK
jgi:DNA mismatch endonuclease (patch repair protein)